MPLQPFAAQVVRVFCQSTRNVPLQSRAELDWRPLPPPLPALPALATAGSAAVPKLQALATAGSLPLLPVQAPAPAIARATTTPQLDIAPALAFAGSSSSTAGASTSARRSHSVDSAATIASGDTGVEVHTVSQEAGNLMRVQQALRDAHQSTDLVGDAPAIVGSQMPAKGKGRVPMAPHSERDDVGWLSLYQANWGGRRQNKQLAEHMIRYGESQDASPPRAISRCRRKR